ncbi:MAG TPA: RNA 2',3'-cyclic phosphodiesterase [Spongiibacteraceae bacterium]|nr:RNA 2',3'-cyclic phosphodiesterase [Spongiibacteraceae bacterium]
MALMRLFFAVPLPAAATLELGKLCARLPRSSDWLWLDERDWHITLAFLGDTDGAKLPALCELGERVVMDSVVDSVMDSVADYSPPVSSRLTLTSLQWWPDISRPRLLAAVGEASEPLRGMRKLLTAGLREMGVAYDGKPLRPHVTLMRLARGAPVHDLTVPPCAIEVSLESLALYRSERERGVTHYRPLWQRELLK